MVNESLIAISSAKSELKAYDVMVDVGAGAGILGYAWLEANQGTNLHKQVVFLEPDPKAGAFLRSFFGAEPRATVITSSLEGLNRESLMAAVGPGRKAFAAARAFSGKKSLDESFRLSGLQIPLYVFQKEQSTFLLKKKV